MSKIFGTKDFYIRIESLSVGVTGSCNYLVFHFPDGTEERILIDCGLFVLKKELEFNREFSFDCKKILAVLVTHAHTDHYARIPCLYHYGFTGKVYGSEYTIQKIKTDAMKNYFAMRKSYSSVLYEEKDATDMMKNCSIMQLNETYDLTPNIQVTPLANAHTKGAVMYLINFRYETRVIRVLFTGDYKSQNINSKSYFPLKGKKYELPITIVTEATHGTKMTPKKIFQKELEKAIEEQKSIIVIANGDTRCETISNEIKNMKAQNKIPKDLPIFLEFKKNFDLSNLNLEVLPSNITFVNDPSGRKNALYEKRQKIVIVTNRGTTDFFLKETIENSRYAIFYTNHVSKGSIADRVINTPKGNEVIISKRIFVKGAYVKNTEEYSDHDFADGLIEMLLGFKCVNGILLEHGEEESKSDLRSKIMQRIPKSKIFKLERGKAFRITETGIKYTK